ncbi:MAG: MFS transporter [Nocardioides sp.]
MTAPDRISNRGVLVWTVALSAYFIAVFHRSSLAVAGLVAQERFEISASQLATFTMLQLLVYAGMQIPVGLLVDRFGPRRVLLSGVVVLTLAQVAFGLASTYPTALTARFFVGMGDAMTFICVLRLVASWFPTRTVPLFVALTGAVGQMGAIVAAIPMTWALGHWGWTNSYLAAAGLGPALAIAGLVVLRDAPDRRHVTGKPLTPSQVVTSLGHSWSHPGTRLGFWIHFTTPFSATTMSLLWGQPFFVLGEGHSEATAGVLLTVMVAVVVVSGPLMGIAMSRAPWHRSTMAITVIVATMISWGAVLAWPGQAPVWLLTLMVIVTALGGPASMIGFDMARTSNPVHRYASASGIINVAGFVAALIMVIVIGWILDWRTPAGAGDPPPSAFVWAFCSQYLLWTVGLVQVIRYRIRTRALVPRDHAGLVPLR